LYPNYGNVILSTHINYEQNGEKKKIIGSVVLKDMKLFYESKFLDPANDSDMVVITKEDKKKKEDNSFLENTYIDVSIDARDAQYRTKDIGLTFRVGIKAKKEFGQNLGMLGKIHEMNGYDVNKNIKIEVGQHQKTIPSQSIDVFFRKKFR